MTQQIRRRWKPAADRNLVCGSELARDEVIPFNINGDRPTAIASKLAPTVARALARAQVLLLGDVAFLQTQVSQCLGGHLGWQWDVAVLDYDFPSQAH